ncbi:MAG: DMT family transporter [Candidatus Omnitrophica bacterium]|nr:DMT family transporter [Candidatus Omnitrophota bacterium]
MGYIFALIAVFTWGSVFVISRFVISNNIIDPFCLAFWRFFGAWIFLLFFIKFDFKKVFKIFKNDFLTFLLLSISGIYLMSTFIFLSLKTTSASISSILMNSNPIFVSLITFIFLKEKISLFNFIGVIIGFLGCAIVIKGDILIFSWENKFGNLWSLLAAICWAIYTVLGEKPTKKYGAFETTFIASFIGSIFLFLTVIILKLNILGEKVTGFLSGIYLGIVPTGIGFTLWFKAFNYIKPTSLAPFQYLTPIITIFLSLLILKEKISSIIIFGMFLIFFSIFLTQIPLLKLNK